MWFNFSKCIYRIKSIVHELEYWWRDADIWYVYMWTPFTRSLVYSSQWMDGWMDGYLRIWYTQWRSSSFNYLVIPQLFFKTPSPLQPKQWFHNIHLLHIYHENGHIWIASNCRPSSAREWSNDGWMHGVNTSISNLLNNRWLCHINYYFWSLLSII